MTGCCRCCALAGCALPDGWLLPAAGCCALAALPAWLAGAWLPACAAWPTALAGTAGVRCGRAAMLAGATSGGC
jgi:hypothetical protein